MAADLVLYGDIVTMHEAAPRAQALAVPGGQRLADRANRHRTVSQLCDPWDQGQGHALVPPKRNGSLRPAKL